ncbi:MAG: hypothetical protein KAW56_14310 [Candidatus Marinimicrobia bacterium]|nr:hypothetical protein [candidate division WOR-3 bacterium]MCK4448241.1 hypothetical protein [Candidatus Neomarinimicrobiota bacterium]
MGSFSSDNSIEFIRFERQSSRCAPCGKILTKGNFGKGTKGAWEAHHIDGDPDNNNLANYACLCINPPEECHKKAH